MAPYNDLNIYQEESRALLTAETPFKRILEERAITVSGSPCFLIKNKRRLDLSSYLDWTMYSLIIIAMVWESLFSFYRYYTMKLCALFCGSINLYKIVKRFCIYGVVFIALFIIQTQIYFYIFPLVFMYYFLCNLYWILNTSSIIIRSVQHIEDSLRNGNLLYKVILLRNLSILSLVSSSINLAAFIIIYNIEIVYYFPFIWSLSITFFTFNFIRNRQCIKCNICRRNSKKEKKAGTVSKLVVHIENIDKDKERIDIDADNKKEQNQLNTPLSLPIFNDSVHIEPQIAKKNKSRSAGNLLSNINLQSRELSVPSLKQQTKHGSNSNETPISQVNDGTVYCGYDDIAININANNSTPSAQKVEASSTNPHPMNAMNHLSFHTSDTVPGSNTQGSPINVSVDISCSIPNNHLSLHPSNTVPVQKNQDNTLRIPAKHPLEMRNDVSTSVLHLFIAHGNEY